MSIELNWHATLPILIGTYPDSVTPKVYSAMCDQRRDMLATHGGSAVLLLDMQHLDSVRDSQSIITDNLLVSGQVVQIVVVVANDLFERLTRSRETEGPVHFLVKFFGDWQTGLDAAEQIASDLMD